MEDVLLAWVVVCLMTFSGVLAYLAGSRPSHERYERAIDDALIGWEALHSIPGPLRSESQPPEGERA